LQNSKRMSPNLSFAAPRRQIAIVAVRHLNVAGSTPNRTIALQQALISRERTKSKLHHGGWERCTDAELNHPFHRSKSAAHNRDCRPVQGRPNRIAMTRPTNEGV
jgi:hypothetical protein